MKENIFNLLQPAIHRSLDFTYPVSYATMYYPFILKVVSFNLLSPTSNYNNCKDFFK